MGNDEKDDASRASDDANGGENRANQYSGPLAHFVTVYIQWRCNNRRLLLRGKSRMVKRREGC
jgi:hypothetical protein